MASSIKKTHIAIARKLSDARFSKEGHRVGVSRSDEDIVDAYSSEIATASGRPELAWALEVVVIPKDPSPTRIPLHKKKENKSGKKGRE